MRRLGRIRGLLVLGFCAGALLGHSSDARAQSADLLAVSAWRIHFEYSVRTSIDSAEQQVDYQVMATGDGVLARSPNAGTRAFQGEPKNQRRAQLHRHGE